MKQKCDCGEKAAYESVVHKYCDHKKPNQITINSHSCDLASISIHCCCCTYIKLISIFSNRVWCCLFAVISLVLQLIGIKSIFFARSFVRLKIYYSFCSLRENHCIYGFHNDVYISVWFCCIPFGRNKRHLWVNCRTRM